MSFEKPKYTDNWKIGDKDRQDYARAKYAEMSEDEQFYLDDACDVLMEKCPRLSKGGALTALLALGSLMNERVRVKC